MISEKTRREFEEWAERIRIEENISRWLHSQHIWVSDDVLKNLTTIWQALRPEVREALEDAVNHRQFANEEACRIAKKLQEGYSCRRKAKFWNAFKESLE